MGVIMAVGYYVIYRVAEEYILHEFNRSLSSYASLLQTEVLFLLIIAVGFAIRLNTYRLMTSKGVSQNGKDENQTENTL